VIEYNAYPLNPVISMSVDTPSAIDAVAAEGDERLGKPPPPPEPTSEKIC